MQRGSDIPLPARALRLDDIPGIARKAIAMHYEVEEPYDDPITHRTIAIISKWLSKILRDASTRRPGLGTSVQGQIVHKLRAELNATHALSDLIRVLPPQGSSTDCEIDVTRMADTFTTISGNGDVVSWSENWSFPETTSDFVKTVVQSNAFSLLDDWESNRLYLYQTGFVVVDIDALHGRLFPGHLDLIRAVMGDSNIKSVALRQNAYPHAIPASAMTDYVVLACEAVGGNPTVSSLSFDLHATIDDDCAVRLVRLIQTSKRLSRIGLSRPTIAMSTEIRQRLENAVVADGPQLSLPSTSDEAQAYFAEMHRQGHAGDSDDDGGGSGSYF